LCDAFQVPKPLSLQLLPFGKSDDDLGELTFGVMRFLLCLHLADGPRGPGGQSAPSQFVAVFFVFLPCSGLIRFCFRFSLQPVCEWSELQYRTVRGPRGRSARSSWTVRFSRVSSGGSVRFNGRSAAQAGQSAARVRTVRCTLPDGPRGHRGQSALPGRTVRQRLAALLLGSIPPFLSCASACASRNRS
jgi:hypothetical protein